MQNDLTGRLGSLRQALGNLLNRFMSVGKIAALLLAILLLGTWYLMRPKGVLTLAVPSHFSEEQTKVFLNHFAIAAVRAGDIARWQSFLSFSSKSRDLQDESESEARTHPPHRGQAFAHTRARNRRSEPSHQLWWITGSNADEAVALLSSAEVIPSAGLADVTDLALNVSVDAQLVSLTGKIDFQRLLSKLYELFGWHDNYLIVSSFSTTHAAEGHSVQSMAVRLHPLDKFGRELVGNEDEIRDALAMYIYETLYREAERQKTVRSLIPPWHQSSSPPSLHETVNGFRALQQGTDVGTCGSLTRQDCLTQARKLFDSALQMDLGNPHAQLGLGWVFTLQAVDALADHQPYQAGVFVMQAAEHMAHARASNPSLRRIVDALYESEVFGRDPFSQFRISPKFLSSLGAYRQAVAAANVHDPASVRRQLSELVSAPPAAQLMLELLKLGVALEEADERQGRQILRSLEELGSGYPDDLSWVQLHAFNSCRWQHLDNGAVPGEWRLITRRLDDAVDRASEYFDLLRAYLMKARCLTHLWGELDREAFEGPMPPEPVNDPLKDVLIEPVLRRLERNDERRGLRPEQIVELRHNLGHYYAERGEWDLASGQFLEAMRLRSAYLLHVQTNSTLREFQQSDEFDKMLRKVLEARLDTVLQ